MPEQDTRQAIPAMARHVYGPRPVGALLPALTRAAFRRHGTATAALIADWPAIIGPALAAVTVPRRLAAGTLTLACAGPVALELQHLTTEVIARVNTHLGGTPVQRLRFVQMAPLPVPPAVPAHESAAALETARRTVADLPDGELREALARLGGAVLASTLPPP